MTKDIDYKKIGLKCGVEIHQQLDTKKLFCNCPSIIRDDKPSNIVKRNLRAVIGEDGNIDKAALTEMEKQKTYHYETYDDTTCLIELDEAPPNTINQEALDVVLQVSKMLNANIVDEIQVMRKTVVDGSNTSGFQRTSLIASDGRLSLEKNEIGIESICIEEDSAKIVQRKNNHDVYNLSRLGIPLIEIATAPQIYTPEDAKKVCENIGMILRSTRKVKRGLGTIRQDVNVSIKDGVRVEIKGAQDLSMIKTIIINEIDRQSYFLKIPKKMIISKITDLTSTLSDCKSKVIRAALNNKGNVLGIKINSFNGKLKEHIYKNKRLGSELSDYAKVIAGVNGLFHSDELPNYGIDEKDIKSIKEKLECKEDDAFIIIADNKIVANKALEAVIERLNKPLIKEVRRANLDGSTTFLRPIPGASRMYPETDCIPIKPDIKNIILPELIKDKIIRYEKTYSIPKELATQAAKESIDIEHYIKKYNNIKPLFIAETLISTPKQIKTRYKKKIDILNVIDPIFEKLNSDKISKDAVFEILVEIANGKQISYNKYKLLDDNQIKDELRTILDNNRGAPLGALMGMAMKEFRGKCDGKKISQLINEILKNDN